MTTPIKKIIEAIDNRDISAIAENFTAAMADKVTARIVAEAANAFQELDGDDPKWKDNKDDDNDGIEDKDDEDDDEDDDDVKESWSFNADKDKIVPKTDLRLVAIANRAYAATKKKFFLTPSITTTGFSYSNDHMSGDLDYMFGDFQKVVDGLKKEGIYVKFNHEYDSSDHYDFYDFIVTGYDKSKVIPMNKR